MRNYKGKIVHRLVVEPVIPDEDYCTTVVFTDGSIIQVYRDNIIEQENVDFVLEEVRREK